MIVAVSGMIGLLGPGLVAASRAILASRSLPAGPVAPDDAFAVTINNVGLADGFGSVVETLPAGFSYVDNSAASTDANAVIDAEVYGQTVTFTVVGVDSFTYMVTVGSDVADGPYTFSGSLEKLSGDETIADTTVTVEAGTTTPEPSPDPSPEPSPEPTPGGLSRSLPADPVARGDEFSVTISNIGLADGFGEVVETLPAGFSYVDGSATSTTPNVAIDDSEVSDDGRTVTFTLVAVDSFTYRVTVGSDVADGPHTFSGFLKKLSGTDTIADSTVTVGGPAPTPGDLSRSLPASPVAQSGEFAVTINNVGLADGFGSVVETLPAGFNYVDNSAGPPGRPCAGAWT